MKLFALLLFVLCSCSSLLTPPPIPDTDFLSDVPGELINREHRVPFQRSWADPLAEKEVGISFVKLRNIHVETNYLKESTRKRFDSFEAIEKEGELLAKEFRDQIISSIKKYPENTVQFYVEGEEIENNVIDLQIEIVELVPQAVARKILSTGLGFISGIASIFGIYGDSVIAIEGKFMRASDGKILGAFADRHAGKYALIDLRIFSKYHQSRENIREWSNDIAEILNTPASHKVKGESVLTLYPW